MMFKPTVYPGPPPYLPITVSWFSSGKKWTDEIETETEWVNFVWQQQDHNRQFTVEEA